MYALATQRSGGTAFCLNYAFEHNIEYGGELTLPFVNPGTPTTENPFVNLKQLYHETGIQPTYTMDEFLTNMSELKNPSKIFLVTVPLGIYLIEDADFLISRKNIKNISASFVNYTLKISPEVGQIDGYVDISQAFNRSTGDLKALAVMLQHCKNTGKQMTWYEDHFNRTTEYTLYNNWSQKARFETLIDRHIESIDFQGLNENIIL
jgi:hypothetical protein